MSETRPDTKSKPWRRVGRFVGRWILRLSLSALALLVVAIAVLHTDYGRELVRKRVERELRSIFVGEVRVGRLEGSLLMDFSVHDVEIRDAAGDPALSAERLRVSYSLLGLLRKHVQVDLAQLNGVRIHAEAGADGSYNLAHLLRASEGDDDDESESEDTGKPSPWTVGVTSLRIDDLAAVHRDSRGDTRIKELFLEASIALGGGTTEVSLGKLTGSVLPPPLADQANAGGQHLRAEGRVRLRGDAVEVETLSLHLGAAHLQTERASYDPKGPASGRVIAKVPSSLVQAFAPTLGVRGVLELALSASRDSADDVLALGVDGTAGGATVSGTGSVDLQAPSAELALTLDGLNGQALWRDAVPSNLHLEIRATAQGTSLETAKGEVAVLAEGAVDKLQLPPVRADAQLTAGTVTANVTSDSPAAGANWLKANARYHIASGTLESSELLAVHPQIEELARGYANARGDIALKATAAGPLDHLQTTGELAAKSLASQEARARGASGTWDITLSEAGFSGTASIGAKSLRSGGSQYGAAELTATSTGVANHFEVAIRNRGPRGSHDVRAKSQVILGPTTTVNLRRLRVASRGIAWHGKGGQITLGEEMSRVQVRKVRLRSPAGDLRVDGDVVLLGEEPEMALKVVAQHVKLPEVSRALVLERPLTGETSITATLKKTRGKPVRGDVRIGFENISEAQRTGAAPLPKASGTLEAVLRGRALNLTADLRSRGVGSAIAKATAIGPKDPLDIEGWLRRGEDALQSATLQSSPLRVAAVSHLAPDLPKAGTLAIEGELGRAGRTGHLRIGARGLVHPKTREAGDAQINLDLADGQLVLTGDADVGRRLASTLSGVVRMPGSLLSPKTLASMNRSAIASARIDAKHVDLAWWDAALNLGGMLQNASAAGSLVVSDGARDAVLTVRGTQMAKTARGAPQTRFSELIATVDDTTTKVRLLGTLNGKEAVRGDVQIDAGFRAAEAPVMDLSRAEVTGRFDIEGLPLPLLQTIAQGTDVRESERVQGTLVANAEIGGTLLRPTAKANAHIVGGAAAGIEFTELKTLARYSEQHLSLIVSGAQKAGGTLSLSSETDLGLSPTTRSTLRTNNWDLSFAKSFVPERSISGVLSTDVNVAGALAAPSVTGKARLRDGSVNPGAPLYSLRNLSVDLVATPSEVRLTGTGTSGRGNVEIRGHADVADLVPQALALDLSLRDVPVEAGPMTVFIDTATRVEGHTKERGWRFDVDIGNTVVHVPGERSQALHPDSLPSDIVFVDSITEAPPALTEAIASAPSQVIDVYIRAPETIAVRGDLVRTIVDVDLHAHLAQSLSLQGTVATRGGWLEIFGRRYRMRRGDVAFAGSTDPSLDIELTHEFAASTLIVAVGGTGQRPELDLRSDPPRYDEAELLSFVLGASPDDDPNQERTAAARATSVASNYVAGELQSAVRDVVPIDVLKIDLDDDAAADKLTLGKWLTDRIFLAYRRRFEAQALENANEAVMEYRFRRRWLLELSYGDQGTGGADVLWNHRF